MPDRIYIFNHKIDDKPYHYNAENSEDKNAGENFSSSNRLIHLL